MNDAEREQWVLNLEWLYTMYMDSKQAMRSFVRLHRSMIDSVIEVMSERDGILCMVCALTTSTAGIDGVVTGRCVQCMEEVWIAPTSVQIMATTPRHEVWCLSCAAKHLSDEKLEPPTPDQLVEVVKNLERETGN